MVRRPQKGFTLVEMIMVIVITGIIGGMVAVFLRAPVQGYFDVARRADMTDIADTALRRIGRDVRTALPNSVRVAGACGGAAACFLEFLPTSGGGRYRAEAAPAGASAGCGSLAADVLDFTAADGCFEALGVFPAVNVGDQIVVYNQGTPGLDAYSGNTLATDNRRQVSAVGVGSISITSAAAFPFDSCTPPDPVTGRAGGCRFHVVTTPVTYACDPAAGTLTRWRGYAIQAAQPVALPGGGASDLLANNVSDCRFAYDPFVSARNGLVSMNLAITRDNETITLYSATHVSNAP